MTVDTSAEACEHEAFDLSACEFVSAAAMIRQLVRERDDAREALRHIANASRSEDGCFYTNRRNIDLARSTLKGTSQ